MNKLTFVDFDQAPKNPQQDWIDFIKATMNQMPKQSSPVELATYVMWLLQAYRPDPYAMQIVLSAALTAYAEGMAVPQGTKIN